MTTNWGSKEETWQRRKLTRSISKSPQHVWWWAWPHVLPTNHDSMNHLLSFCNWNSMVQSMWKHTNTFSLLLLLLFFNLKKKKKKDVKGGGAWCKIPKPVHVCVYIFFFSYLLLKKALLSLQLPNNFPFVLCFWQSHVSAYVHSWVLLPPHNTNAIPIPHNWWVNEN